MRKEEIMYNTCNKLLKYHLFIIHIQLSTNNTDLSTSVFCQTLLCFYTSLSLWIRCLHFVNNHSTTNP